MEERYTLLLTGTINPEAFIVDTREEKMNVVLTDPIERYGQYTRSIERYIKESPFTHIVFIENSGYPFDSKKYEAMAKKSGKEFEFICIDLTLDKKIEMQRRGKSYGEAGLIDYAMENSRLIAEDTEVYKVTGRLYWSNADKIISGKNKRGNEFHVANRFKFCRTDVFKIIKKDYFLYFHGLGSKCCDKNHILIEHMYYKALEIAQGKTKIKCFRKYPVLEGVSAGYGNSYQKSKTAMIIRSMLYALNFYKFGSYKILNNLLYQHKKNINKL